MTAEPRPVAGPLLAGVLLGGFVLAGTALVTTVEKGTRARIEANQRAWVLKSLDEILARDRYDNTLADDTIEVTDRDGLGSGQAQTVYRARMGERPVAAILNVVAPDGYAGPIHLLVGIDYAGNLTGVRVADHRETPGLGDAIEAAKSDWIRGFDGRSLANTPAVLWAVRSEDGAFDQFTGATITPRAVVRAVHQALIYFQTNRDALFATDGAVPETTP